MITDNDKHRIEQASLLYSGNHNLSSHLFNGFIKGAEYATIYEREKFAGYTVNSYKSKVIKELEAERSELRNKILDEIIQGITHIEMPYYMEPRLTRYLNSLKTK